QMTNRPERNVLQIARHLHRRRLRECDRLRDFVHYDAGNDRADVKRRRDIVGNMKGLNGLGTRETLVCAGDHLGAFDFIEFESADAEGAIKEGPVALVAACYNSVVANGIPVRLSGALASRARAPAEIHDRSLTEQVEHWARLGQIVESAVLSSTVLRLKTIS